MSPSPTVESRQTPRCSRLCSFMPAALLTSLALGQMVASGGDFLTRNGFATLVRAPPVPASPGGVATTRRGRAPAAPHEEGIASAAPPWRGIASAAPR